MVARNDEFDLWTSEHAANHDIICTVRALGGIDFKFYKPSPDDITKLAAKAALH